jgi:hypothetical protein
MSAFPKGNCLLLAATILDRSTAFFDLFGGELLFAPQRPVSGLGGPMTGLGVDFGVCTPDLANPRLVVASNVTSDLAGKWHQLSMRHDMVDESAFECFVGQHEIARKAHFSGSAHTDGLGE